MVLSKKLLTGIANKSNLSIDEIKNISPEDLRRHLTKKTRKDFKVISVFPIIGRGNVLRDGIRSSKEINKETDKILGV